MSREVTPIDFFKVAYKRSKAFISGGKGNRGRRDEDDLRAAVVFAVASIDAFFRAKILHVVRKNRYTPNFTLTASADKIIKRKIAKALFSKDFGQLNKIEQEAVVALSISKKPIVIKFLGEALEEMSFQNTAQLNEGAGRPKKNKKGPKINILVQLENLFNRRHKIVHQADLSLGRKHRGQARQVKYESVKRWIDAAENMAIRMDSLI